MGRTSSKLRRLKLALFVALRIVRSRRTPTLSLVTMISVIGIACGVMALTVVLSVTAGFETAFQDRILGLYPHLVVTSESSRFDNYEPVLEKIRATPGVVGATPLTGDSMMVAHGIFRAGATVQGVDLASVRSVIDIDRLQKSGSLDGLAERPAVVRQGANLLLEGAVEGTWITLLLEDGRAPTVLADERAVPDAGQARIKLLDLRSSTAKPTPAKLLPRGGDATDLFALVDEITLPGAPRGAPAWGPERELPAGEWELSSTGERLRLEAGTLVALVLLDGPQGERPRSLMMVEPGAALRLDRTAHIRVIDARHSGPLLSLRAGAADTPALATTAPGSFTEFKPVTARLPGILLGSALAKRLRTKVGDELTLVTPLRGIDNKMMGPFGMLPSSSHFLVAGTFEAGFHDHDSKLAIINIEVAQRFLNRGRLIHTIAVRTADLMEIAKTKSAVGRAIDPFELETLIENTESLRHKIALLVQPGFSARHLDTSRSFVGGLRNLTEAVNLLKFQRSDFARRARFRIYDWKEKNINIFSALELQKVVLTMFFLIIILVGSFVVVGSQIMVVHEKTTDIAIMKAMGATSGLVRLIFTLQGALVALAGAFFGLVFGVGLIGIIDLVDYRLEASIYLIDHLPVEIDPVELLLVALGALLTTLLTTQISAGRAASKTPVEGLRAID